MLPQFAKILEKLFNVKVDNFTEIHSILSIGQYGFRPNMIGSQIIWKTGFQYVSFDDTDSTLRNVICGIPRVQYCVRNCTLLTVAMFHLY